jgi:hypothetical protein
MNKLTTLTLFACLILGFQNCSRVGSSSDSDSSTSLGSSAPSESVSLADVSAVEIPYSTSSVPVNTSGEGLREARKSGVVASQRLVVALDTGHITLVDSSGEAVSQTCLDESRLEELKSYIASAKICEAEVEDGAACTQVYEQGYASLSSNSGNVNLGESLDGCGRGYKDFCGSVAASFKGLISSIKLNWQQLSCGN